MIASDIRYCVELLNCASQRVYVDYCHARVNSVRVCRHAEYHVSNQRQYSELPRAISVRTCRTACELLYRRNKCYMCAYE
jgi:hypothetical protein